MFISFSWGNNRFVLLIGSTAIKIARIRPLRTLGRFIAFPFASKANKARFRTRYGSRLALSFWNYLVWGLESNRNERVYSQTYDDPRVEATYRNIFGYFIVLQRRGSRVTKQELELENPFAGAAGVQHHHLEKNRPCQFCRNRKGKVVLVDYGRFQTVEALTATVDQSTRRRVQGELNLQLVS